MQRELVYIIITTIFFLWGGIGLIRPQTHQRLVGVIGYVMAISGLVAIWAIFNEIFAHDEYMLFGFAQALALTSAISLLLLPLIISNKSIISYFSPLWFLIVTLSLTMALLFPANHQVILDKWSFEIHFFISMFAYALFTIWAVVAIVLLMQISRLHNPQSVEQISQFSQLPPLLTIEKQSLWLGRITLFFLTLVLITGFIYSEIAIGKVALTHKFIFALLTWLGVLIIVCGQIFRGWRGKKVNIATLVCYGFILLAYVGYRFVLEIILQRG